MGWASVLGYFSQNILVTLVSTETQVSLDPIG
jgi:hypothetical protein